MEKTAKSSQTGGEKERERDELQELMQALPLLTSNPHSLVPFLEFDTYLTNPFPNLENIHSPRIFSTHTPYALLPSSIKESTCRIVYLCRNPLDRDTGRRAKRSRTRCSFCSMHENMKVDIVSHLKTLADFTGFPFSLEEERQGMIEEIASSCSFNNLKDLEVNKTGKLRTGHQNDIFFRKGEVGDWTNYLTPAMAERMEKIMEEKLEGSGFPLKRS
ncbi:hypothetical protein F0562_000118 [Nyssa sinensis]|uniref:Sulfotransferase n=1 Tax=Nyssa sinensis TaxID=561372 RepID=A0A5J5C0L7_9ASTE|nr:hypothetical protein F0562_000118 [Nyssa sinensis]